MFRIPLYYLTKDNEIKYKYVTPVELYRLYHKDENKENSNFIEKFMEDSRIKSEYFSYNLVKLKKLCQSREQKYTECVQEQEINLPIKEIKSGNVSEKTPCTYCIDIYGNIVKLKLSADVIKNIEEMQRIFRENHLIYYNDKKKDEGTKRNYKIVIFDTIKEAQAKAIELIAAENNNIYVQNKNKVIKLIKFPQIYMQQNKNEKKAFDLAKELYCLNIMKDIYEKYKNKTTIEDKELLDFQRACYMIYGQKSSDLKDIEDLKSFWNAHRNSITKLINDNNKKLYQLGCTYNTTSYSVKVYNSFLKSSEINYSLQTFIESFKDPRYYTDIYNTSYKKLNLLQNSTELFSSSSQSKPVVREETPDLSAAQKPTTSSLVPESVNQEPVVSTSSLEPESVNQTLESPTSVQTDLELQDLNTTKDISSKLNEEASNILDIDMIVNGDDMCALEHVNTIIYQIYCMQICTSSMIKNIKDSTTLSLDQKNEYLKELNKFAEDILENAGLKKFKFIDEITGEAKIKTNDVCDDNNFRVQERKKMRYFVENIYAKYKDFLKIDDDKAEIVSNVISLYEMQKDYALAALPATEIVLKYLYNKPFEYYEQDIIQKAKNNGMSDELINEYISNPFKKINDLFNQQTDMILNILKSMDDRITTKESATQLRINITRIIQNLYYGRSTPFTDDSRDDNLQNMSKDKINDYIINGYLRNDLQNFYEDIVGWKSILEPYQNQALYTNSSALDLDSGMVPSPPPVPPLPTQNQIDSFSTLKYGTESFIPQPIVLSNLKQNQTNLTSALDLDSGMVPPPPPVPPLPTRDSVISARVGSDLSEVKYIRKIKEDYNIKAKLDKSSKTGTYHTKFNDKNVTLYGYDKNKNAFFKIKNLAKFFEGECWENGIILKAPGIMQTKKIKTNDNIICINPGLPIKKGKVQDIFKNYTKDKTLIEQPGLEIEALTRTTSVSLVQGISDSERSSMGLSVSEQDQTYPIIDSNSHSESIPAVSNSALGFSLEPISQHLPLSSALGQEHKNVHFDLGSNPKMSFLQPPSIPATAQTTIRNVQTINGNKNGNILPSQANSLNSQEVQTAKNKKKWNFFWK